VSLTIHTEEDNQRQLLVTVEVAEERVRQAMRAAARDLAREVQIPGFRKGKAPYQVIVRRVGEDVLREEAVEKLAQPIFEEMMDELDPAIFSQASLDEVQTSPLVMKYTIPLSPVAQLGDYRDLRREVESPEVTDEAVADALEKTRVRHQIVEEVERPAETGDMVTISGSGWLVALDEDEEEWDETAEEETAVALEPGIPDPDTEFDEADDEDEAYEEYDDDDEYDDDEYDEYDDDDDYDDDILFDEESIDLLLDTDTLFPGTPFVENIAGLSAGENKSFTFTFPTDYEDEELAGREANFEISVTAVKNRTLPQLDDELAQKEGPYETLDDLRNSLRQSLQKAAETEAKNALIEQMIDDLLLDAVIVYPPVAVENEIDGMIEQFKNQMVQRGWEWEDYLRLQGMPEADLRELYREAAVKRLERQTIFNQFVMDEKLRISPEDLDARLEVQLSRFEDETLREAMREYLGSQAGFNLLGTEILMDKAAERIKAILQGDAPDLASLELDDAAETDEEE
jgi:trigger factor